MTSTLDLNQKPQVKENGNCIPLKIRTTEPQRLYTRDAVVRHKQCAFFPRLPISQYQRLDNTSIQRLRAENLHCPHETSREKKLLLVSKNKVSV